MSPARLPLTKRLLIIALVPLLGGALLGCQPTRLRPPVYGDGGTGNFPDPSVMQAGGRYYAFSTNSGSTHIQVMHSTDLFHWSQVQEAVPNAPSWARSDAFWAPTVARIGSRYVMYFGAKHRNANPDKPGWCIAYATATDPAGPYTPGPQPLFCQVTSHSSPAGVIRSPSNLRGSIDPQIYTTGSGNRYLHFKALDNPIQLWGIQLSSDGRSTVGTARGLVALPAKAPVWEYSHRQHFTVLENPTMSSNAGSPLPYYLYYSGGDWQSRGYGTGVAACRHPLGPCVRATGREAWMEARGTTSGPGGLSVFSTGSQRWVAYHSWKANQPLSQGRRLHIEPLGYFGIVPVLMNRAPTGTFAADAPIPAQVTFHGRADDLDTGRGALVRVFEGGNVVATRRAGANKQYSVTINGVTPGRHRYCAFVYDDNGGPRRSLGCDAIDVLTGPLAAEGETPSTTATTGPSPTTVPPTTAAPPTLPPATIPPDP